MDINPRDFSYLMLTNSGEGQLHDHQIPKKVLD
jgi:hypothetical protein